MRALAWKVPLVLAFACIAGQVWGDGPARPTIDLQKELRALRGLRGWLSGASQALQASSTAC